MLIALTMVVFMAWPGLPVHAADRARITGPSEGQVGGTIQVTLGFPEIMTKSCDFFISYPNTLLKFKSVADISGLNGSVNSGHPGAANILRVGTVLLAGDEKKVSNALRVTFEVLAAGSGEIVITEADNGKANLEPGAKISLQLKAAAPPTTTTPTTPRTTTTTRTTTTSRTPSASSTSTTAPSQETTPSSQPEESLPDLLTAGVLGQDLEGKDLNIPETTPAAGQIPESFEAAEISWKDGRVMGYRSETLPHTLFWLADEAGSSRFYLFDEETQVFHPYLRTEWSSRYFVFSVLAEEDIPAGFEAATARIWGSEVPVYKPLAGHYVSKAFFDQYLKGEENPGGELPANFYLLALRMNDTGEKGLYFYDATLDSLIRADLWLVPVEGTVLADDTEAPPQPSETEPVESQPPETEPLPSETELVASGETLNLFGYSIPIIWLIAAGALLLLLLIPLIWLIVRTVRANRIAPVLTLGDLDEDSSYYDEELSDYEDFPLFPVIGKTDGEESSKAVEEPDTESSWDSLEETLKRIEEKKAPEEDLPAGLNPISHRRPERDDPEDAEEL